MNPNHLNVTKTAERQARQCGFTGDVCARVRGLVAHSVPTTHETGNRAYGPFLMLVRGQDVLSFSMIGPRFVDRRPVSACKLCEGLMIRTYEVDFNGKRSRVSRPCPRVLDPTLPLCDMKETHRDR